jgi:hypothetical protein
MPGPSARVERRAHRAAPLPGRQCPAWPIRPLGGKACVRARPDHVAMDHGTPPARGRGRNLRQPSVAARGVRCQWLPPPPNAALAEAASGESKKGLQSTDFFLTMTSAYSSLIKYQRESLEKSNLPGRAFVRRFIFPIYSLNVFGDFCASAVRHFGNSRRVLCSFARVCGPRSMSPAAPSWAADLEVVTP